MRFNFSISGFRFFATLLAVIGLLSSLPTATAAQSRIPQFQSEQSKCTADLSECEANLFHVVFEASVQNSIVRSNAGRLAARAEKMQKLWDDLTKATLASDKAEVNRLLKVELQDPSMTMFA